MSTPFEYIGELIDPEQGTITLAVYACRECGSLVVNATRDTHAARCHTAARDMIERSRDTREIPPSGWSHQ